MSESTAQRKGAILKLAERAGVDESIARRAYETFESEAGALLWLRAPALALRGRVPAEVARTAAGRKRVILALQRIDFGVP